LALHEVDLGLREQGRVTRPVLVLGGRVVEVLGGDDQRREKDAVARAVHALGDFGEARLEAFEVDEGAHEGRDLDVGLLDEDGDERLEGGDGRLLLVLEARLGRGRWRGGESRGGRRSRRALDHLDGLFGEVGCGYRVSVVTGSNWRWKGRLTDHVLGDGRADKVEEGGVVPALGEETGRVTATVRVVGRHGWLRWGGSGGATARTRVGRVDEPRDEVEVEMEEKGRRERESAPLRVEVKAG
jgi:hypothetical protein